MLTAAVRSGKQGMVQYLLMKGKDQGITDDMEDALISASSKPVWLSQ